MYEQKIAPSQRPKGAWIKIACALLMVALSSWPCGAEKAEKRIALVIGNSNYRNTTTLANPLNDSADMAAALKNVGFAVILQQNLDKTHMEDAVAQFARLAQDADAALFYYAGHGMQYRGANYLVPIDAKLQDEFKLTFELTRLDDVLFGLERARGVKILILDACRDNPLLDRLTQTASARDLLPIHGLAKITATRGMVIAYSTQANQVAVDGTGRNSPFTGALIKEIAEPGVEVGTMFRRVAYDVDTTTKGQQLPELSLSLVGDFYLNTHDTDLQAWAKIRESSDRNAFAKFIGEYPNSVLVGDAREHIVALDRAAEVTAEAARRAQAQREQAEREARARALAAQAERDRLAREQAAREQAEKDRLAQEQVAREQSEKDRLAKEGAQRERLASDQHAQPAQAQRQEIQQVPPPMPPANAEAINPHPEVQTAMLSPPAQGVVTNPTGGLSGNTLVEAIKKELKRVGCYAGDIDGDWTNDETKLAVSRFVKYAKLSPPAAGPAAELLDALRGQLGKVCPLLCGARQVEQNGRCVAKSCRAGYILGDNGICVRRRERAKTASHSPISRSDPHNLDLQSPAGGPRSVVGRSVNWGGDGVATYGKNGTYKYVAHTGKVSTGRYRIEGSQICVEFSGGGHRCDTVQRPAGGGLVLTNRRGRSFMGQ